MGIWQEEVDIHLNRVDLAIQKLRTEGTPVKRDEALQVTQALCELLRGLKLDTAAVEKVLARQGAGQDIRPEEVLTPRELALLAQARNGEVPCPHCAQALQGEFVYVQVAEDDYYAGVKLSCWCGFVEY